MEDRGGLIDGVADCVFEQEWDKVVDVSWLCSRIETSLGFEELDSRELIVILYCLCVICGFCWVSINEVNRLIGEGGFGLACDVVGRGLLHAM